MKRLNKFVNFIKADGQYFIYDISTGTAIAMNPQLYKIVRDAKAEIGVIAQRHPELYQNLEKLEFLVEEDYDESDALINQFKAIDRNPKVFSIIVNPTLDCNLRCWYCYESHQRGSMMTQDTMDRVKRLMIKKVEEENLERLTLTFFGGEPLIGWKKVVEPLLEYGVSICQEKGKLFTTGFTTNGVLLTEEKFDRLQNIGLGNTSFQISFDGNRTIHDLSRIGEAKQPTYDVIMKNVKLGAEKGFKMNLRFNYTPENLESFVDILAELDGFTTAQKKNIRCDFQKVWQKGDESTREASLNIAKIFKDFGFPTDTDTVYHRHLCYADLENQITINYNGDLFKCTAREFAPSDREGELSEAGDLILNDKYQRRMSLKYANASCRKCEILPLCNGRCSQAKMEHNNVETCPLGFTAATRKGIIRGSLYKRVFDRILPLSELINNVEND